MCLPGALVSTPPGRTKPLLAAAVQVALIQAEGSGTVLAVAEDQHGVAGAAQRRAHGRPGAAAIPRGLAPS